MGLGSPGQEFLGSCLDREYTETWGILHSDYRINDLLEETRAMSSKAWGPE